MGTIRCDRNMDGRALIFVLLLALAGCVPPGKGEYDIYRRGDYIALRQNGRVWMTNTPEEDASQQEAYDKAHGIVWTFGLGLGIFAEKAAVQGDVEEVVVIEISQEVIDLVWPELDMRGKGKIIRADMWDWLKTAAGPVDFIYADIWTGDEKDFAEQVTKTHGLTKRFGCEVVCWNEQIFKERLQ